MTKMVILVWGLISVKLLSTSGVTDGVQGDLPHEKLYVKTRPRLADILIFSILLVFCRLLFFCVFRGVFVFLASIDLHDIRIYHHFLTFFLSVG